MSAEFRKMRRFKQQVSDEECRKILREEKRGVLSVLGDEGYPYGIPLDFYYNEENGKIYFHGAVEGHKIDALKADPKASFCVMDQGYQNEGEWWYNVTSVVCFGKVSLMENSPLAKEMCRRIAEKYFPGPDQVKEEMEKHYRRVQMLELTVENMTGKKVREK